MTTDLTREQIEARIATLQEHQNKFPQSPAFIFELEVLRLALQAPQFNQPAPKDNEHEWGVIGNITMCKKCGWLKGGKKASEPCKGSPGISLRETAMTEAPPSDVVVEQYVAGAISKAGFTGSGESLLLFARAAIEAMKGLDNGLSG